MITCSRCGKDNRPDYRFCLGCGAELPKAAEAPKAEPAKVETGKNPAPKPFPSPGKPASVPMVAAIPMQPISPPAGGAVPQAWSPAPAAAAPAPVAPMQAVATSETVLCSSCSTPNNRNFKFCGACGTPLPGAAAPAASIPVAKPAAATTAALVLIRPDGSEGDRIPLAGKMVVGRDSGGVFASDSYLSPKHATLEQTGATMVVTDESSLNGVFVRIAAEAPLELVHGAIFRIGQEVLRFERLPAPKAEQSVETMGSPRQGLVGRICLITGRESIGNCYTIPTAGLHLGRERGDLLFPDDGYVSGLHCRIYEEGGKVFLTDLGSSNGTFSRISGKQTIASGSLVLMGQQLFRIDLN